MSGENLEMDVEAVNRESEAQTERIMDAMNAHGVAKDRFIPVSDAYDAVKISMMHTGDDAIDDEDHQKARGLLDSLSEEERAAVNGLLDEDRKAPENESQDEE